MPFLLTRQEDEIICTLAGQISVASDDPMLNASKSVKIIRLMRMLKLARMFKASRVLKRVLQDVLMTKLEFTFAMLTVWQLFFALLLLAHWQASVNRGRRTSSVPKASRPCPRAPCFSRACACASKLQASCKQACWPLPLVPCFSSCPASHRALLLIVLTPTFSPPAEGVPVGDRPHLHGG